MKLRVHVDQNRVFQSHYKFFLIFLKFEPVNTFMHNWNIFLYHNLCKIMRVTR